MQQENAEGVWGGGGLNGSACAAGEGELLALQDLVHPA